VVSLDVSREEKEQYNKKSLFQGAGLNPCAPNGERTQGPLPMHHSGLFNRRSYRRDKHGWEAGGVLQVSDFSTEVGAEIGNEVGLCRTVKTPAMLGEMGAGWNDPIAS
jgi:hypothetical protein